VKSKIALNFSRLIFLGFLLVAASTRAQTIGYRQTNLSSNLPDVANNVTPDLINPWGIAFLSGQPFFIANNKSGSVTSHDASGSSLGLPFFTVPDAAGTGLDNPTGIVADQNSFFGGPSLVRPFILVTEEGTILTWGPDANGNLPQHATPRRRRASAVYKGAAILNSGVTQPVVAVTDFHNGFIETFLPGFAGVALPGSFTDPNLPAGYAPFGIQVVGQIVVVTYALQDAAKHDPVIGPGNGIVSLFDTQGNFLERFATGGALNAPWGVTGLASANFGPFSSKILIGNFGDGTINAFDPVTGNFVGQLTDGDGVAIVESGLHALAFRSDGVGDPNTLYFSAGVNRGQGGLFGAITTGLVSITRIFAPTTPTDSSARITANVAAAPGNFGNPTGTVTFLDGSISLGTAPLVNGSAAVDAVLSGVRSHNIAASYTGDAVFLASSDNIAVPVTALPTMLNLVAPANAAPGSAVTLTATVNSMQGIPTGQIVFHDGNTSLGTAPLDGTGVATLRINTLSAGANSLTASYTGDDKFGASTSAAVTITIANADFSLGAAPISATVVAGQSTQFMVTVTPAGGFADNVTFSCAPITGITCTFSPAIVTPANGAASTTLTVTTSASVPRYGLLPFSLIGPAALLSALLLFALLLRHGASLPSGRASLLTATAVLAIAALSVTLAGCGGYGSTTNANRGTASVMVTAQSGAISHTSTVMVTVQ